LPAFGRRRAQRGARARNRVSARLLPPTGRRGRRRSKPQGAFVGRKREKAARAGPPIFKLPTDGPSNDKELVMRWIARLFRRKPPVLRNAERMAICGTFFRM
jgi:hypothetical protein